MGRMPARVSRRASHRGEGPTVDGGEHGDGEPGAEVRRLDAGHAAKSAPAARRRGKRGVGQGEGKMQAGRQVAGDTGDAPGVGAVPLDGDVEDGVGLESRAPRSEACRARPARRRPAPGGRLRRRRGRALRPSTACRWRRRPSSCGGRSRSSPGSTAPTGANGTRSPTEKLEAPQTISSGSPPASTTTTADAVGPLNGGDLGDPGDDDVSEPLPHPLDLLDHQAQVVERGHEHPDVIGEGGEVTEPAEWSAHERLSRRVGQLPQN